MLGLIFALFTLMNVPLDEEIKNNLNGECSLEVVSKVTKSGDNYTYMYSIKNTGKKDIRVKWDVLSKAMQYGSPIDLMFDLKAGENLNFVLEHPDPPTQAWGILSAYYSTTKEEFDEMLKRLPNIPKGVKIQMPNKSLHENMSRGVNSVLPSSYTTRFGVR